MILPKIKEWLSRSDNNKTENTILFEINQNQDIKIKIDINDSSLDGSQKFGNLLFMLNEGYCTQNILEILTDIAKQNSHQAKFVQDIITVWSARIIESDISTTNTSNQTPIVSPSQFSTGK